MTTDESTLIAGVYQQNTAILEQLRSLTSEVAILRQKTDPSDRTVLGFDQLHDALADMGLTVSLVRLKRFRNCDVLRTSTPTEDLECWNFGSSAVRRWRFHVGRCKDAIARFERLPKDEQKRILGKWK